MSSLNYASLVAAVVEVTHCDAEELTLDVDLESIGIDSLAIIRLIATWRAAGIETSFVNLAKAPTLRMWAHELGVTLPSEN